MKGVHKEILQLVYYSKGGFTWEQVYNKIPTPLRRFYIRELSDMIEDEREQAKSEAKGSQNQNQQQRIPDSVRKAARKAK